MTLALERIGAVINPVAPIFRQRELRYMLRIAGSLAAVIPAKISLAVNGPVSDRLRAACHDRRQPIPRSKLTSAWRMLGRGDFVSLACREQVSGDGYEFIVLLQSGVLVIQRWQQNDPRRRFKSEIRPTISPSTAVARH